ncbi:AAA family ATPase [Nocardia amamiensis]|uniref:AAA family ATPase n=1 Tax=Nocardia amamiensis TaxID=404578 RepID=UPI000AE12119|nr:ATP-binding protein [Nocardia amamiensis]
MGNHRSFADENELLLMPAADDRPAVPVVAVYGANASGKSNLLDGLRFMQRAVTRSFSQWEPFAGVPRDPYRFRTSHIFSVASTYVVEILADDIIWTYGFSVDNERVLEEWLFSYPEKRRRVLFQRTRDEYSLGSTMSEHRTQLKIIQELTRPNALFLSAVAQARPDMFQPVHRWFRETLILSDGRRVSPGVIARRLRRALLRASAAEGARLVELVQVADFGIAEIDTPVVPAPLTDPGPTQHWLEMTGLRSDMPVDEVATAASEGSTVDHAAPGDRSPGMPPVVFIHHGSEGVALPLEQESAGTIAWLEILPGILDALDHGQVMVIDEIDTSLHPLLTAALIEMFQSDETNPHGAQLILTTHDSSLLGTVVRPEGLLRRDQVWFVEKSGDGSSTLYPLTDYKPRSEHNLERRYLGGSYGAVPHIDFHDFAEVLRHADTA